MNIRSIISTTLLLLHTSISGFGQTYNYRSEALKLSLMVGNQVTMASDEVPRFSYNANASSAVELLDKGDYFFYNGDLNLAVQNYTLAIDKIIPEESKKGKPLDIYRISAWWDSRFTDAEKQLKRAATADLSKTDWLVLSEGFNALGMYYQQSGNYYVAEMLLLKALEIRATHAGKTSKNYVASLHNLAVLRMSQGRYDAAEDMLKYVIRYAEKAFGKHSYQYVIATSNQAILHAMLGRVQEGLKLLNGAWSTINEVNFSDWSKEQGRLLTNIAMLENQLDQSQQALAHMKEALTWYEGKNDKRNLDFLQLQLQMARLQITHGDRNMGFELLDKTLSAYSNKSTSTLTYAYALRVRAESEFEAGNYQKAKEDFLSIREIFLSKLGSLHQDYLFNENRIAICEWKSGNPQAAFDLFQNTTENYFKVIRRYFYNMSEKEKTLFWNSLKPQLDLIYSFALNEQTRVPDAVMFAYNTRIRSKGLLYHNTSSIRDLIYSQSDEEIIKRYKEWIDAKDLLAAYYSVDQENLQTMGIQLTAIEENVNEMEKVINHKIHELGGDANLIDISYEEVSQALGPRDLAIEVVRVHNTYGTTISDDEYCIFILNHNGQIKLERIGATEYLESKILKLYKHAVMLKADENVSWENLWKPLESSLSNAEKIYFSPDGIYNLINVNSLKSTDGSYVIDNYTIEILPNTALLGHANESTSNQQFVLVGDPTFGDPKISPLPGTGEEIRTIHEILNGENTHAHTGQNATEISVKNVVKPKVLHIATHGFFMEDDKDKSDPITPTIYNTNPLIRSGLLLSGAKLPDNASTIVNQSDGILTAYEAMNMNLQHTDLVILSACETGQGEVINGEGVYGLSRAFTIAGARNLIMSLWKVDDEATQRLMTLFYKHWIETGDLKASFVSAQKELRVDFPKPYYWAAFVLVESR